MANINWKTNTTTLPNGRIRVYNSGKYADDDGNNKLSTKGKRIPIDKDSPNSIVAGTTYSISDQGYVTFHYRNRDYGSLQSLANSGIRGYNDQTTDSIKNNLQSKLKKSAEKAEIDKETTANPSNTVNNDGSTDGSTDDDTDQGGDDEETSTTAPQGPGEGGINFTIESPDNLPTRGWRYPLAIDGKLDVIKFTQGTYKGIELKTNSSGLTSPLFEGGERADFTQDGASVFLGIQPQISDSNSVKWNGSELNQIQAFAANLSLDVMNSPTAERAAKKIGNAGERLFDEITKGDDSSNIAKALNVYLAGKAVGVGGALLSRTTGAILNPNLELLFSGPDLRQFNFTFKMSAENQTEADNIRGIINWFKKGMAVKKASGNLFLTAPNVFKIQYLKPDGSNQDAINKIKTCALLQCATNYTPEGNYSTFEDGTMTMYDMTLSFGELNPIYADEFHYGANSSTIGY